MDTTVFTSCGNCGCVLLSGCSVMYALTARVSARDLPEGKIQSQHNRLVNHILQKDTAFYRRSSSLPRTRRSMSGMVLHRFSRVSSEVAPITERIRRVRMVEVIAVLAIQRSWRESKIRSETRLLFETYSATEKCKRSSAIDQSPQGLGGRAGKALEEMRNKTSRFLAKAVGKANNLAAKGTSKILVSKNAILHTSQKLIRKPNPANAAKMGHRTMSEGGFLQQKIEGRAEEQNK